MVSAKVSRVLYHVLLESLTNIVKHAHTQDVCVELDYTDDLIFLSIADQGVGCVVTRYSVSELIRSWHIGIVGMVEWAESVNGSLSVQQNEPRGTKVILQVPLPR
jgi:signal transduction histidine kinase